MKKQLLRWLLPLFLLQLTGPARAVTWPGTPPAAATPSLAAALNPDGTLRPGANGSFDASQFRMRTAPDGRPVFRPAGVAGSGDERWADGFGLPIGADADVRVVVRSGANIYIGGAFSVIGETAASRVARWDGTTWRALGGGITGNGVLALAVAPNGDVYAGGTFTQAGGVAANNVARWNGTAWSAVGASATYNGVNGEVNAVAVAGNGDLYVGGSFSFAGFSPATMSATTSVSNVAKWNGMAWSALGATGAEGVFGTVNALAVAGNGNLYVGGIFGISGRANSAQSVAYWDGTTWHDMDSGRNGGFGGGEVYALALAPNGDVYAGGRFFLGGTSTLSLTQVARWNGAAWTSLSPGGGYVYALTVGANGDVYAGGYFNAASGQATSNVARWNGSAWVALSTAPAFSYTVYGVAVDGGGSVYAGGIFSQVGALKANRLAKWNGTAWNNVGGATALGLDSQVYAVAVAPNGDVYVGGNITQAGGVAVNRIAKWNGTAWSTLGTGAANGVRASGSLAIVEALLVARNGDVYVGGTFDTAGGVAAEGIAKWNGTAWSALVTSNGNGVNGGIVSALAEAPNGDIYVGGTGINVRVGSSFARGVARWNGTSWSLLGTSFSNGVNGDVYALAVAPNGDLYAGGSFNQAGGTTAIRVAKWNGTSWSALGSGTDGAVLALAVAGNGDVYAGGTFRQAGGQPASLVAMWNGTAWSNLGSGFTGPVASNIGVTGLAIDGNGDVYAGGTFTQSGGASMNYVSRWNGASWNSLGTGTNKNVLAIAMGTNNKLYAGGNFGATGDGSKAMAYFGIYDPNAPLATKAPAAPFAALFPNPAHGVATLRLPAGAPRLPVVLTDALGRVVRQYRSPATPETELDLRGLPAGAYVLRCGQLSQRLVVE
ncbi:T9SS type A sorting domain-containing protein [Hymenobacter ruricola]|uniref:T9SS type A sorting domain-containing protein n=1 Tax=Hymenobacter ruricola TaxID=2791023 RepID=A0ABS0ICA0_9BACT|nr:T9SS type A sorting domain-containing protein [Hymenobacter ruricola]MBF9224278.1 T9SS type A sorting domain-containing protein [Hymenobacter ruricola]